MLAFRTVHRTASLKLHNPSRRKCEIIEHAFTEYTLAFRQILDWAKDNRDILESEGKYERSDGRRVWSTANRLGEVLKRSGVRPVVHGSLRESLYADVAETLLSTYALEETYQRDLAQYEAKKTGYEQSGDERGLRRLKPPAPPSFPISRDPRPGAFEEALDDVAAMSDVDEEEWIYRQSRLTRLMRGQYMPLFFNRPDAVPNNRNFSLLADDERGKYYVMLFLLPDKHTLGQPLETTGNLRRLGHPASADPEQFPAPHLHSRSRSAILCPLELGAWHREEFLTNPDANVRSAILVKRGEDYLVNVTFEISVAALEPQAVIGVDRGVAQLMALRVLDFDGRTLHEEMWAGDDFLAYQWDHKKALRRLQKRGKDVSGEIRVRRVSDHTTHAIANRIADLARDYQAQVVIENLRYLDRRQEKFYRLRATPYQAIAAKLGYKLPLRGLPGPAEVYARYTSQMCARCGYADPENRPRQAEFSCQKCGHSDHADLNAATNIALRWLAKQRGAEWWPENIPRKARADSAESVIE